MRRASDPFPSSGRVAYAGPSLKPAAVQVLAEAGYEVVPVKDEDSELPFGAAMLVWGLDRPHPFLSALQRNAVAAGVPDLSDLALLGRIADRLGTPRKRRVLITGTAGKSTTAALLRDMMAKAKKDTHLASARAGYLNALAEPAALLVFTVEPNALRYAQRVGFGAAAVLNLTEEEGDDVSEGTKKSCAEALTASSFGVLGTDDVGAQALLMRLRRMSGSNAREVVPVSGGSTLSSGFFAIERVLYGAKLGRTRRVASFAEGGALIGDHLGQSAAAAAALASSFGCTDDQIAASLNSYEALPGRFDVVGSNGPIVFVDDRAARCLVAAAGSIASCPDVFWIGHNSGTLPPRVKAGLRGSFLLQNAKGEGPPIDGVTTFASVEEAAAAALRVARDLVVREPRTAPVVLFAPGAPGFDEEGERFRRFVLAQADEARLHA